VKTSEIPTDVSDFAQATPLGPIHDGNEIESKFMLLDALLTFIDGDKIECLLSGDLLEQLHAARKSLLKEIFILGK
jgi:hypothetical protein